MTEYMDIKYKTQQMLVIVKKKKKILNINKTYLNSYLI